MSSAIIGFGAIGQALARTFARKSIPVAVASRRAPEAIAPQARAIGPSVTASSLQEALKAQIVILAVPFGLQDQLAKAADWQGKIVIDATNAYGVCQRRSKTRPVGRCKTRPVGAALWTACGALCSTPAGGVLASYWRGALRPDGFRRARGGERVKRAAPISGGTGATRRKSALTSACRFSSMARSHRLMRSSIVAAAFLA
jgi:hypothetical protein